MTEPQAATAPAEEHGHGPPVRIYLLVFGALCFCTAVSFVVNTTFPLHSPSALGIILGVAVIKAVLVGMFFMHLKYEWSKLYFLIVPVAILGVMMMIVLMPDIVVAWQGDRPSENEEPPIVAK